jgi:hypothetical protein
MKSYLSIIFLVIFGFTTATFVLAQEAVKGEMDNMDAAEIVNTMNNEEINGIINEEMDEEINEGMKEEMDEAAVPADASAPVETVEKKMDY